MKTKNENMKNYKLETHGGDTFSEVAKKAKAISKEKNVTVEFEFNEIICLVNDETILELLNRDYMNAHIMEWKTVGSDCVMQYDNDTEIELRRRQLKRAEERKASDEKYRIKQQQESNIVAEQVKGIEIEILPGKENEYAEYVRKNSNDGYSRGVIDYSETWAKLMQIEIAKGKTVKECADETQKGLGYLGITGFMYGCAVNGLSHYWKHGEELRKWHNKEYGVSEESKGVVNPAVFTIG